MRREKRAAARAVRRGPQSYTVGFELPDCAGSSVAEAVESFVRRTAGRRDWAYEVRENEEPHRSFIYVDQTGRTLQIADPLPPLTFASGATDVHLSVLGALVGFRVALEYRDEPPTDGPENPVEILSVDDVDDVVVVGEVRDGRLRPNFSWSTALGALSSISVLGPPRHGDAPEVPGIPAAQDC